MSNFEMIDRSNDRRLNEKETATYLGCTVSFLRKHRLFKTGPSFLKLGRLVRYQIQDLQAYLASNKVETSAA